MITIYALIDDDDTVKYVGSTGNFKRRSQMHWVQRFNTGSPVRRWLQERETPPQVRVLEECDDSKAVEIEKKWIDHYGLESLLNVIPAGYRFDGQNYRLDPESRAKQIAGVKKALTGRTLSDETKAKISAANTGKKRPPEARQRMSEAARRRKRTS